MVFGVIIYHFDLQTNETILIIISFERFFSHPEKSSSLTLRRHDCNSGP